MKKMRGKTVRLLSLFLAIGMLVSAVPLVGAAEGSDGTATQEGGGVIRSKTATLEDDGTYTIDLSGFVTGQTTTTQYASNVPLDVILVLDASSSMLQYKNTPDSYEHTASINGWVEKTTLYHPNTTNSTNLWSANLNNVSKETDLSRASWFYSHDKQKFVEYGSGTEQTATIRGSVMVPVKPGDKIYCSSFQAESKTGGDQDGICVAYFDSNGALLSSVSAADVYKEFMDKNDAGVAKEYIVVPDGAYIMNVPVWNNDSDKVIYNLSLGQQKYRPETYVQFQTMGSKILQQQVEKFAEGLAENAKQTGQDHKLAIVTYGGGETLADAAELANRERGIGPTFQGVYEKYVGVNGWSKYFFTNTGLFVNGEFKNYFTDAALTTNTGIAPSKAYHPIFAGDLDTSKTYYYLTWGRDSHINDDGIWRGGGMIKVTYNAEKQEWYDEEGNKRVPRETPYDKYGRTLFYTRNSYAATVENQLTDDDYKNALANILVNGELNPDIKYATDRYVSRGTTHTKYGLAMALHVLQQNSVRSGTDIYGQEHQGKQIVILFTDGETNNGESGTYGKIFDLANKIKELGATLYTVSVGDEVNQKWLDQISSNYPDGGKYDGSLALSGGNYCINVDDVAKLEGSFESISSEIDISKTTVELGESAVMQDYLAEGLIMPDDFGFGNIKVCTMGIQTSDEITYTTTDTDGDFALVTGSETQNGNVWTATYNCKYELDGQSYSKDLYVSYDKSVGSVSVTGFDYALNFVSKDHPGRKLMVTISGIEATKDTTTDSVIATNAPYSGIAYSNVLYPFEIPQTKLTSKTYVADYAKPMTINPTDWSSSMIGMVSEERLNGSKFIDAAGEIGTNYGKFKQNSDGTVLFTPTTMQWNGFASFYALGRWGADKDTAITTGNNLWTRVNVIPANNVYYEDTFVTNEKAGIAGIVYGGKWEEVDEAGNQKEGGDGQGETAESGESTTENNQGGVHGWEDTLAGDTGYSDGSAHVTNESSATATFTFTGTGVDIYSRTNKKTGIVIAMLYKGDSTTDEEGNATIAEYSLIVDNLAASGDYYQVPTLSLFQIREKDDDGNTVMTDLPHGTYTVKLVVTNADDSQTGEERFTYYLDGIRVYNPIQNLEGNDTVSDAYGEEELNATFVEIRDKLLDANAFSADTETSNGPVFIDRITSSEGDHTDNTQTVEIGTYEVFGPENEVYLSAGQMIAFAVEYQEGAHYYIGMKSLTGDTLGVEINNQAGISVAHTTDLYYEVTPVWTNSSGEGYTDANGNAIGYIIIEANADNRKAAVDESGNVILDESGNQTYVNTILALTKLKVTCPAATTFSFAMVRNADLLNYAEEVANTDAPDAEIPGEEAEPDATEPTEPSTPDDGAEEPETTDPTEPSTPDATEPTEPGTPDDGAEEPETTNPTEPSTPDVEIDNPETEPSTPDVEIENPETEDSEQDWQAVTQKLMLKMIKKIFSGLSSLFDR